MDETPDGSKKHQNKLDLLPDKVKQDMHKLIAEGNKGKRIKQALEDRWLKETDILPVDFTTYDRYIDDHYDDIMKQVKFAKDLVVSSKKDVVDMQELSEVSTNVSLDNRKQAMEDIFNRVQSRLNWIESTQTSYPNPHYEQLIGAYLKEMRTIVEKIIHNKEALERDTTSQIYNQLENALYLLMSSVLNIYKKIHLDDKTSKLEEFKEALKDEMPNILKNFKLEETK